MGLRWLTHLLKWRKPLPIAFNVPPLCSKCPVENRRLTFAAAHVKAHYALAYADAFALALAQERQATLLTGDPEFQTVQHLAAIEWLAQS